MRAVLQLVSCVAFVSCTGGATTEEYELASCALAAESQTCDECTTGPMTCTFGDTSVTANSCVDCQARADLYQALCDAGEDASREEIEADTVCDPVVATL
jgi:hypothetical protein